jgi:hypothetical protein
MPSPRARTRIAIAAAIARGSLERIAIHADNDRALTAEATKEARALAGSSGMAI